MLLCFLFRLRQDYSQSESRSFFRANKVSNQKRLAIQNMKPKFIQTDRKVTRVYTLFVIFCISICIFHFLNAKKRLQLQLSFRATYVRVTIPRLLPRPTTFRWLERRRGGLRRPELITQSPWGKMLWYICHLLRPNAGNYRIEDVCSLGQCRIVPYGSHVRCFGC